MYVVCVPLGIELPKCILCDVGGFLPHLFSRLENNQTHTKLGNVIQKLSFCLCFGEEVASDSPIESIGKDIYGYKMSLRLSHQAKVAEIKAVRKKENMTYQTTRKANILC